MSLREAAPKPRSQTRRPNYPAVLACGAMLLLAACGGRVNDQGAEEEDTGGSGGDTAMPMPTGAGSGGSYDPGTGGSGGSEAGGTIETGGSGGWDPGMPTGAGAGGSYEPDPDAGVGGDYDAGPPIDAAFEPDVVVPEADAGLMDDPCIQACAQHDPVGWNALFDALAPCVCAGGCESLCADSLCGDTAAAMTAECGSCALAASQNECTIGLAECLGNPLCQSIVPCLLACP